MAAKNLQEKKELRQQRMKEKERLTNMYMLNLTWGIVGIIALMMMRSFYNSPTSYDIIFTTGAGKAVTCYELVTWILTGIFAVGTIALIAVGMIKKSKRATNYSMLLGACTLVSLWLTLFNKIRPVLEKFTMAVLNKPVSSYWNIRIPIIAIVVYLVVAFIVYSIRIAKK